MSSTHRQAVFMGASVMDLITYCDRFPKPGETVSGNEFRKGFGGKSANACVMSARLGLKSAMLAKIGDDDFGHDMLVNFKKHDIKTDYILQTKDIFTSTAAICVSKDGENNIIYVPGPSDLLTCEEVTKQADSLFDDDVKLFVSTFECKPEVLLTALKIAKEKNVMTLVNSAPPFTTQFSDDIFTYIDILSLNESEAFHMTSIQIVDKKESAQKAMDYLIQKGCKSVLLTLGSEGVLYLDSNSSGNHYPKHIPASKVIPIDTTGAGDAFVGSIAYYLVCHPKMDMQVMCERAGRIAGVSVTRHGTQSSYPWKNELPQDLFD